MSPHLQSAAALLPSSTNDCDRFGDQRNCRRSRLAIGAQWRNEQIEPFRRRRRNLSRHLNRRRQHLGMYVAAAQDAADHSEKCGRFRGVGAGRRIGVEDSITARVRWKAVEILDVADVKKIGSGRLHTLHCSGADNSMIRGHRDWRRDLLGSFATASFRVTSPSNIVDQANRANEPGTR